jgi:hypothetical protein
MKKNKKRKFKLKKILLIIILLALIIYIGIFIIDKKKKSNKPTKEVEVIDSIDDFGYRLNDNETKYYNELFNKLKEILKEENYDEEEYASIIAQLFLADFYDLDNKVMKGDVGGTQFVYEPYRENFEKSATAGMYKYVESNVYGDRKQQLPSIKEITKENIESKPFKYNNEIDNKAYYLTMNINYTKDLGYATKVELVLIHNNDRLEVAKLETKA